jgi:APA family basic amino acid/polyamine antiporter
MISCLGLMYYLPPASWWRFVGWLLLGLALYTSYGYCRSTIGRDEGRPAYPPLALRVAALGFLSMAIGSFVVPHGSTAQQLVKQALDSGLPEHGRALAGILLVVAGLVLAAAGGVRGFTRAQR